MNNNEIITARVTAVHRERYQLLCEKGECYGRLKTKEYYEANSKANQELKKLMDTKTQGTHDFKIPINDTRLLSVSLAIDNDSYQILKWKEVSSETWENDDRLPVLGSEQGE